MQHFRHSTAGGVAVHMADGCRSQAASGHSPFEVYMLAPLTQCPSSAPGGRRATAVPAAAGLSIRISAKSLSCLQARTAWRVALCQRFAPRRHMDSRACQLGYSPAMQAEGDAPARLQAGTRSRSSTAGHSCGDPAATTSVTAALRCVPGHCNCHCLPLPLSRMSNPKLCTHRPTRYRG